MQLLQRPGQEALPQLGLGSVCNLCHVGKGSCFGGNVGAAQPAQRTLAAKQAMAQKQAEKGKQADRKSGELEKQLKKERLEKEKLQKEIEQLTGGRLEQSPDAEGSVPGYKEKLKDLEEKKYFLEKYGYAEELAKTLADLKELKASKEAKVPEGHQLRRAEQEVAKRQRQSQASKAAVAEVRQQLEALEKKDKEIDEKLDEAEKEFEKVKLRIATPGKTSQHVSWADISHGHKDFLLAQPPELLAQCGINEEKLRQFDALLASAAAVQKAAVEKKAVEEAEEAKRIGEQGGGTAAAETKAAERAGSAKDSTEGNVAPAAGEIPAGAGAPAHAYTGGGGIEADLMDLCESEEPAVAERAKQTLEDLREAKRRRTLA